MNNQDTAQHLVVADVEYYPKLFIAGFGEPAKLLLAENHLVLCGNKGVYFSAPVDNVEIISPRFAGYLVLIHNLKKYRVVFSGVGVAPLAIIGAGKIASFQGFSTAGDFLQIAGVAKAVTNAANSIDAFNEFVSYLPQEKVKGTKRMMNGKVIMIGFIPAAFLVAGLIMLITWLIENLATRNT